MSDPPDERASEILDDAAATVADLPPEADPEGLRDELDDADEDALRDFAAAAREVVEESEPADVLAAVGLSELPDGSEPSSLPEAIAAGDPGKVADLRSLLILSKLAGEWRDDEAVGQRLSELRETLGERAGPSAPDEGEADAEGDEAEAERAADERDAEGGDLESTLQSAMDDALGGFGDEVAAVRERLEGMRSDEGEGATADDGSADGVEAGAEAADEAPTAKAEAETAEEGEGLLGGLGDSSGQSSGVATMHSTVAPSPSKRADMRAVRRFSTMPKRHRSDEE
ncbi:hypothetical protein [Salinilacihabitans rarus]|uniref:hypothetical protein n=1 Tax=Salinilacihabitans rarus TaxID=2961596 RepID=UPI0020C88AFC|nr:hypothetical protein [Salinilacihabitans rarus]